MKTTVLTVVGLAAAALAFVSLTTPALAASAPAAAEARAHSVDYVIGMLEAGMDQRAILARIHDEHLTFRLAEGDLDRLRDAGAGDELIDAVSGRPAADKGTSGQPVAPSRPQRLVTPETRGQAPQAVPPATAGAPPVGSRPDAGESDQGSPDQPAEESGAGPGEEEGQSEQYEAPHGGYPYYVPGYDYGYYAYGYPGVYDWPPYYYYSPFYNPYYYSYYFGYPYYYPRHRFFGGGWRGGSIGRTTPRGSPRGSMGGSSAPRSAPRSRPRGH
jgi:hypothetical protein